MRVGRSDRLQSRRAAFTSLLGGAAAIAAPESHTVQSVTGPVPSMSLGVTLMHEHVVTYLRAPDQRREDDFDAAEAFAVALPFLRRLRQSGCRTLVEPTPIHIGRQPETLRLISEASDVNIICATGFYGAANQKFIPEFARHEGEQQLAERIVREAQEGLDESGIKPGIIKTGVNNDSPLPSIERKLVSAALLAHKLTGLAVASHTGGGRQALEQLELGNKLEVAPSRFIWVHAQNEKDHSFHTRAAKEGMWVEFDGLRHQTSEWHLQCVRAMGEAGLLHRTLLSHDAGWYRPGAESQQDYRGYTYLFDEFLPRLRASGFSAAEIDQLLIANPAAALVGAGSSHTPG